MANHMMASGNWNQSVWQERHIASGFTSASYAWQTFSREALKLDISFSIYRWEYFTAVLNGWKQLSRLQRNKESGPSGSLQSNGQDNTAASALADTVLHSGGLLWGSRAVTGMSDRATLPCEVTHPNETAGSRGSTSICWGFCEEKKGGLFVCMWFFILFPFCLLDH